MFRLLDSFNGKIRSLAGSTRQENVGPTSSGPPLAELQDNGISPCEEEEGVTLDSIVGDFSDHSSFEIISDPEEELYEPISMAIHKTGSGLETMALESVTHESLEPVSHDDTESLPTELVSDLKIETNEPSICADTSATSSSANSDLVNNNALNDVVEILPPSVEAAKQPVSARFSPIVKYETKEFASISKVVSRRVLDTTYQRRYIEDLQSNRRYLLREFCKNSDGSYSEATLYQMSFIRSRRRRETFTAFINRIIKQVLEKVSSHIRKEFIAVVLPALIVIGLRKNYGSLYRDYSVLIRNAPEKSEYALLNWFQNQSRRTAAANWYWRERAYF